MGSGFFQGSDFFQELGHLSERWPGKICAKIFYRKAKFLLDIYRKNVQGVS